LSPFWYLKFYDGTNINKWQLGDIGVVKDLRRALDHDSWTLRFFGGVDGSWCRIRS